MFSKKFSLTNAYRFGATIVADHFIFFLMSMLIGGLVIALALAFLGMIDLMLIRHHFVSLIQMFHNVSHSATGAVRYGGTTIYESISKFISPAAAQQFAASDMTAIDIKHQEMKAVLSVFLPTMLVMKMVVDMISIGWTKIALNYNANQSVSLKFLFEYYYLVPRVFLVNLIVGVATLLGTMLFILPGIIIYQRLRFAKFLIIDKNLGMVKALQSSWAMTDGAIFSLFGFTVLSTIIETIASALVVLWLFVGPLSVQVEANVYRQLLDK